MKKQFLSVLTIIVFFYSCLNSQVTSKASTPNNTIANLNVESAILWQQTSAEYTALCHQAFNIAYNNLEKMRDQLSSEDVVIIDLDETILDNSPYNAKLIKDKTMYSHDSWMNWTGLAEAELIPGALDFLLKINDFELQVIFVSNRTTGELTSTIKNLSRFELNYDESHFFLKSTDETSEKTSRRNEIADNNNIIMLIGDNLADFNQALEEVESISDRKGTVEEFKNEFGNKFIILPNIIYGNWQKALKNDFPKSDFEKALRTPSK